MPKFFTLAMLLAISAAAFAGESVSLSDFAQSKIYKPKGLPPFDSIAKQGKSFKFTLSVPGVDPATFTPATELKIVLTESSLSPDTLTVKFSDDPKYVAGSKSVTIKKTALPPGVPAIAAKLAVLEQYSIKFGKDTISITYTSKYLPFRAQSYINYGFLPNLVRFPEGDGSTTKPASISVTLGTVTKTFGGLTYEVSYKNKKAKEEGLWTGSAKGSINFTN